MKGVLKEIENSQEMIVLFVDEIHLLMGAGSSGEGGMDAANCKFNHPKHLFELLLTFE